MSFIVDIVDVLSKFSNSEYDNIQIRISSKFITITSLDYVVHKLNIELKIPSHDNKVKLYFPPYYNMIGCDIEVVSPYMNVVVNDLKATSIGIYGNVNNICFLDSRLGSICFYGYVQKMTVYSTEVAHMYCLYIDRFSIRRETVIENFTSNITNIFYIHSLNGLMNIYCSKIDIASNVNDNQVAIKPSDTCYINENHIIGVEDISRNIIDYVMPIIL